MGFQGGDGRQTSCQMTILPIRWPIRSDNSDFGPRAEFSTRGEERRGEGERSASVRNWLEGNTKDETTATDQKSKTPNEIRAAPAPDHRHAQIPVDRDDSVHHDEIAQPGSSPILGARDGKKMKPKKKTTKKKKKRAHHVQHSSAASAALEIAPASSVSETARHDQQGAAVASQVVDTVKSPPVLIPAFESAPAPAPAPAAVATGVAGEGPKTKVASAVVAAP